MLELGGITVRFGRVAALDDVILTVPDRSVVALIGPSGSGKSTLLRVIAGLEHPDAGEIRWDGESILEVPPHRRDFGMMFQDYALFPHRSVAQNVAFGLRMNRFAGDDLAERTKASLELVGLAGYGSRSVGTLSGGEQQRVALARTLAPEPRLVLLDEPLGALDRALRERLVEDMRQIFESVGATALYVTHDREEAFTVADRVAIIDAGHIIAEGTPEEIWYRPATARAAELIGMENRLSQEDLASLGLSGPASALDSTVLPPGAINLSTDTAPNGTVVRVRFRGEGYRVTVEMDGGSLLIASSDSHLAEGTRVRASVDPSRPSRFPG